MLPDAPALHPWIAATHRAAVSAANSLWSAGGRVELLGAVAHTSGRLVLAGYALAFALTALLGLRAPLGATALLLALLLSARRDLDGGQGWLRALVPRRISRILLLGPQQPPRDGARQLLILLPASPQAPARLALALALPAGGLALLAAGLLLRPFAADIGGAVLLGAAALLLLVSLGAAALADRRPLDFTDGAHLARAVQAALPPDAREVTTLAIIGGLGAFNDGAEILLRNHHARFRRRHTRVLAWCPSPAPLGLLHREGLIQPRPAPPHLLGLAGGIPTAPGLSAAAIAAAHGWSALGLVGGSEDPERVAQVLGDLGGRLLLEEP